MKLNKAFLFLIAVFTFISIANSAPANTLNTGFSTVELSKEEQNMFIDNINLSLLTTEPDKKSINCFDVSEHKLIAIGQNTSNRKTICVYSNEGVFQYGYTFNCTGDFGVEWDEKNLNIYFVRSSVIVSVSPKGEVLGAFEVENTIDNNSYINHFFHTTKRTIGKDEYLIGNNMGLLNFFATSYSQIIFIDSTGTEHILYDVNSTQFIKTITIFVFALVIFSFAVVIIFRQFVKRQK